MADGGNEIREWFKMSRPQRIAAIVIVAMIMVVTIIQVSMSRSTPLPDEMERRALELAGFQAAIDSAGIDTIKPLPRKKPSKQPVADREIEPIPTFQPD